MHYRWRAAKSNDFILKFCTYLTLRKGNFSWLTKYLLIMKLRFDAMLYSITWITKILTRAMSNVRAGRKFPTPAVSHLAHWQCPSYFKPVVLKLFVAADPSTAPKPLRTPLYCQRLFDYWEITVVWLLLSLSTSSAPERSKFQACHQLPSPKSNKKVSWLTTWTCHVNMPPDYTCGAIKLNNGPNGRIKTSGFWFMDP